jgi:hypothetical protein
MKPGRFTQEQIIEILREQEAGAKRRTSAASSGCSTEPHGLK